jgi:uncharacterized membrane protein YdjX (TVP38/TMEM64 family)
VADDPGAPEDGSLRVFASRAARREAVLGAIAIGGGLVALTVGLTLTVPGLTDPAWLRARIAAFGAWAPVAFVALEALQVIVAPIPGQLLGGVAGYLFGGVLGTVYSMTGVLAGSLVALGLSRRYGRPYVEGVIRPEALDRWDAFLAEHGVPGLFVLFLLPTFPDDLLCFVAGLSEIRARTFVVLVVLGRGPSFVAAAYAGSGLAAGRVRTVLLAVTALAIASVVVYLFRDGIAAAVDRVV